MIENLPLKCRLTVMIDKLPLKCRITAFLKYFRNQALPNSSIAKSLKLFLKTQAWIFSKKTFMSLYRKVSFMYIQYLPKY
jgi:hypothetical protein